MLVDSSNSAGSAVTGAIRQASQATGTSFNYLLATAQVESGLNPKAGAATSSARGLFQFIEQTWLSTIKQDGKALGYGRYADAISKTASGGYEVRDPAMRSEILKLRNDPTANAVMAGAFTKSNADVLQQRLGRPPSEGELYIAHFLGVGSASKLITLAANNPNARASHYFSHAAVANTPIFFDRSGAPRSVEQVRNVLTARYDVARGSQDLPAVATQAIARPALAAAAPRAPDTAGITGAFAAAANPAPDILGITAAAPAPASAQAPAAPTAVMASAAVPAPAKTERQPVFLGLFADGNRTAPLAPLVTALWGVPDTRPASAQKTASGGMLDLFKDLPKGS